MTPHDVVVLGAGLTGTATALELVRSGVDVVLLDQDEIPMNRASLRNEGKIHLGFIYANDRSFETASIQQNGALTFRSLLSRWIGVEVDSAQRQQDRWDRLLPAPHREARNTRTWSREVRAV